MRDTRHRGKQELQEKGGTFKAKLIQFLITFCEHVRLAVIKGPAGVLVLALTGTSFAINELSRVFFPLLDNQTNHTELPASPVYVRQDLQ